MTDPLDDLYGAPLDEFTARRNDLVKWLKANGDKAEAARIGKLKKPTVPAWAINQLARRETDGVAKLIEIQRSLAEAGDARALQKLGTDRRRAVTTLTEKAKKILADAGSASGAATLEKISSSLLAATSGEDLEILRAGRLEKEFTSSGFEGAFGGLTGFEVSEEATEGAAEEGAPDEQPQVDPAAARRAREHAEKLAQEAEKAESKARALTEKVAALEAQLAEAREAAEAQADAAASLRQEADEALEALTAESAR